MAYETVRYLLFLLVTLFAAFACLTVALGALFHYTELPTPAMEPVLHVGDHLAEAPLFGINAIYRGSLVVFQLPYDQTQSGVSRIVGLPGDRIQVTRGHLLVNGKRVYEPYANIAAGNKVQNDFPSSPNSLIDNMEILRLQNFMYGEQIIRGALVVPKGSCFVLNDNRSQAFADSRTYGPVAQNAVFGRPCFVYSARTKGSGPRFIRSSILSVD